MIGKNLRKIIKQLLLYTKMFCVCQKWKKIYSAYISKQTWKCKKQIIRLMIPKGEGWHYITVKKLSALLGGISSKHDDDFYCSKCFRLFWTKNKLESHKKVCEKKYFFNVVMLSCNYTKILEFNQYRKSDKAPFTLHKVPSLKISKTKNDLTMKFSSYKHVLFVSIICLFSCLVSVTWCGYDIISITTPNKLWN